MPFFSQPTDYVVAFRYQSGAIDRLNETYPLLKLAQEAVKRQKALLTGKPGTYRHIGEHAVMTLVEYEQAKEAYDNTQRHAMAHDKNWGMHVAA